MIITKAPLESLLTFSFLAIAKNSIDPAKTISLFLIRDGVWFVKNNQKNIVVDLLRIFIQRGAGISVSKDHMEATGIENKDLISGLFVTNSSYKVSLIPEVTAIGGVGSYLDNADDA